MLVIVSSKYVSIVSNSKYVFRSHRQNACFSGYEKHYSVSKVMDRIDSYSGHCPFLADK